MIRALKPGLVLVLLFVVIGGFSVAKMMFRARNGFGDHIAYYRAAQRVMAGADPYAATGDTYVYLYPPAWSVAVWPLTTGGPVVFGAIWAGVLGASWLVMRRAVRRLVPRLNESRWGLVVTELLLARFLLGAWSSGQVTLPLGALCLGGLALAAEGWTATGAALIGIAASIKVYPLFLAVALARLGGRRAVGALALSAVCVSVLPAVVCGPERFVSLVRDGFLGSALINLESQRWWSGRCAPLGTAWHLAGGEAGAWLRGAELLWGCALAALVWVGFEGTKRDAWLGCAVLSMLVATPMLGENYLALLMLPVAVLVARGRWWVLAIGAVLLNVHSPLIVGKAHCDALERLGLSALGLAVLWSGSVWELMGGVDVEAGLIQLGVHRDSVLRRWALYIYSPS